MVSRRDFCVLLLSFLTHKKHTFSHIHTHTHTHKHTHTLTLTLTHSHTHTLTLTHTHTHKHTYAQTYAHTHMHTKYKVFQGILYFPPDIHIHTLVVVVIFLKIEPKK